MLHDLTEVNIIGIDNKKCIAVKEFASPLNTKRINFTVLEYRNQNLGSKQIKRPVTGRLSNKR